MSDFDCCALSDREVIALDMAARAEARAARFARWIAPTLLDHYPNGPYAVHVYYPATGRALAVRNQTADSAVAEAEEFEASGKCRDVHVSLDTCG